MNKKAKSCACYLKILAELTVLTMVFTQMASAANTYYVATNGPGGGATDWATATNNIQDAISLCSSSDVVLVSNGVYETGGLANWPAGTILTNRVAITTAYITVMSANNDPTNTIIKGLWASDDNTNGVDAVRCVYMVNNSSLIGFRLTNGATLASGAANDTYGGGVLVQSTNAIISNCVIAGNSAVSRGGGAYYGTLYNCMLIGNSVEIIANTFGGGACFSILYNCTLTNNSANQGGGTHGSTLYNCILSGNFAPLTGGGGGGANDSKLYNCILTGNSSAQSGGGAYYSTLSNCLVTSNLGSIGGGVRGGTLYNCILSGNRASVYGGGAYQGTLYNCTLTGNEALSKGGGVFSDPLLCNCIIYFNYAPIGPNYDAVVSACFTNSCTTPIKSGWDTGNITNDPMFITNGSEYGTNHVAGNYRLSSGSPCINTGTNQGWMTDSYDFDGRMRIRYGTVDMGAYEFIHRGTIFRVY